jgi:hypothetical protein
LFKLHDLYSSLNIIDDYIKEDEMGKTTLYSYLYNFVGYTAEK